MLIFTIRDFFIVYRRNSNYLNLCYPLSIRKKLLSHDGFIMMMERNDYSITLTLLLQPNCIYFWISSYASIHLPKPLHLNHLLDVKWYEWIVNRCCCFLGDDNLPHMNDSSSLRCWKCSQRYFWFLNRTIRMETLNSRLLYWTSYLSIMVFFS